MVEIAICLAIMGIALVAIIGVLPIGINVQKDNREETLIGQDATVFIENIRNGTRGLDDLTNYVLAITNSWTSYDINGNVSGNGVNGYAYANFSIAPGYPQSGSCLTNGANIIGLLSTPEYMDNNGDTLPTLFYGGISNHIVAYVRSLSGPAVEKPPQNNGIILGDSFSYKMICNNAPLAMDTNLFSQFPEWTPNPYKASNTVSRIIPGEGLTFWRATVDTRDFWRPGQYPQWAPDPVAGLEQAANLHELRLTFLWPLLPSGNTGAGRHTFATTVAGQIVTNTVPNTSQLLYFFQPQSFTSVP